MQCRAMSCKDFRNTFHFFQRWSWQPVLLQAGIWPTLSCLQHFNTFYNCFILLQVFHYVSFNTESNQIQSRWSWTWGLPHVGNVGIPPNEVQGVAALRSAVATSGMEPLADPLTLLRFYRHGGHGGPGGKFACRPQFTNFTTAFN